MIHRYWIAALVIGMLAACQTVPPNTAQGRLVASQGVIAYFDDPEVTQLIAGQGNDIKCERNRRVGTHLIVRVCRTRTEWEDLKRQTKENGQDTRLRIRCIVTDGQCGEGRGGF